MQAIRIHAPGGPEAMRLEDLPDPVPAAGQVVVDVEAAGLNYIDVYFRTGLYPAPMPLTLGVEAAGTVTAVGPGVSDVGVGDRVAYTGVPGAYADRHLVPADRVVRLPDGVSTREAAAAMLQGMTAHYLALSTFPLGPGHRCLVHAAAGGVGLLLCQVAKMCGATVIGTVSTDAKAALASAAGADHLILYTQRDFVAEVRRLTDGEGVHVVYDSVGATTFMKSLDCLRPRGIMVLFGQSSGAVPPLDLSILNWKGSLFVTRPSLNAYVATRDELTARAGDVLGWVRERKLTLRIDREFPLARAADAHRALEGRETAGKVLIVPR